MTLTTITATNAATITTAINAIGEDGWGDKLIPAMDLEEELVILTDDWYLLIIPQGNGEVKVAEVEDFCKRKGAPLIDWSGILETLAEAGFSGVCSSCRRSTSGEKLIKMASATGLACQSEDWSKESDPYAFISVAWEKEEAFFSFIAEEY